MTRQVKGGNERESGQIGNIDDLQPGVSVSDEGMTRVDSHVPGHSRRVCATDPVLVQAVIETILAIGCRGNAEHERDSHDLNDKSLPKPDVHGDLP